MNAATMESGMTGDEAAPTNLDGMPPCWSMAADEADDDALPDLADNADANPVTAGPCVAQRATEAQLAAWIDAIVEHNERALAALYDATFSRVFGIVQRIVRRAALAEEVVEDTYFQVWRQAVRFDPARGNALTWLLAIARSRAIDALRHESRFQHESIDDETAGATADGAAPSDELLDLARHQADLHQALMLLGAQPRQLVSLAFFRGLSHEEIAQQTSLPLGTVKSQIRRALQTLRQILGEGGRAVLAS
jgi:RNA polymerase sigma-70 factor (ECF subfamily)